MSDVGVTCVFCKHMYTDIDTNTDTDTQTHRHAYRLTCPNIIITHKHPHTCTRPLRALRETLDLSNRNVLSRFDNFDFMTRPNERKDRLFGVAGGGTLLLQAPMSDLMSLAALMTSLPPPSRFDSMSNTFHSSHSDTMEGSGQHYLHQRLSTS